MVRSLRLLTIGRLPVITECGEDRDAAVNPRVQERVVAYDAEYCPAALEKAIVLS